MSFSNLKFANQELAEMETKEEKLSVLELSKRLMETCKALTAAASDASLTSFSRGEVSEARKIFPLSNLSGASDPIALAARAKRLYQERRLREKFFRNADVFGEPAWDILLDLMIAKCLNKQISVTSACIASSAPLTTALRWIGAMVDGGLITRTSDEHDRRRAFVQLTENGYSMIKDYLEKLDR